MKMRRENGRNMRPRDKLVLAPPSANSTTTRRSPFLEFLSIIMVGEITSII